VCQAWYLVRRYPLIIRHLPKQPDSIYDVPIGLTVTSPSGNQHFTETSLVDGSYRLSITYTLAEAGDYLIMLTKADRTPGTYYTADIIIQ
jgi:hypothetical protein